MTLPSFKLQYLMVPRYSPDKILKFKVTRARSNQGPTMILHTYTPTQCPYQVSTSYTLQFPRYSPDKNLNINVTTARSKVKSRLHQDVAYLLYTSQLMSLASINILHLRHSEIQSRQAFSRHLPAHPSGHHG